MKRFAGLCVALISAVLLPGCSSLDRFDLPDVRFPGIYRQTIQQGNVVTQEMINRLKPGMTRRQVRFILGEPVLANAFREDRWDYIYTIQIGSLDRLQQGLTVYFEDDALSYFEGDFLPSAVKEAQERAAEEAAEAAAAAGA